MCQSGAGGLALLPDGGGVNDQAAWVMDAFSILARLEADAVKAEAA